MESRKNRFDLLRLLFAAWVLYTHCFQLLAGNFGVSGIPQPRELGWSLGEVAVDGFFAVSGWLIAASWLRGRGLVDFLVKRGRRIYPGFVACFLFCVAFLCPLFSEDVVFWLRSAPWGRWLRQMATLEGMGVLPVFRGNPSPGMVNLSLWTIRIEAECYLLAAALGVTGLLRRRWVVLALAVGVALLNAFQCLDPSRYGIAEPHVRLVAFFLAGMALHLWRERVRFPAWGAALAAVALAVAVGAGFYRVVAPAAWSYLVLWAALAPGPMPPPFGKRVDLSYGIYLYGCPIQQAVIELAGPRLHPLALFGISLPLVCALAAASWFLVERPCLRGRAPAEAS